MTDAIKGEGANSTCQMNGETYSCLPMGSKNSMKSRLPKNKPGQPISDDVAEQVDPKQIFEFLTQTVEVIDASATVVEAAAKMKKLNVGTLTISNKGKLEGVITDRDIIEHLSSDEHDPSRTRICEIITPEGLDDQNVPQVGRINADAADAPPESKPVRAFSKRRFEPV